MRLSIISLAILSAADPVAAQPSATLTIDHRASWETDISVKPNVAAAVRIERGRWHKVAPGTLSKPIAITVPASGRVVAISVSHPRDKKPITRWAAIVPGASYRITGNPCAKWELQPDDVSSGPAQIQFDATALPARYFPLVLSTEPGGFVGDDELGVDSAADDELPEDDELTTTLHKPGISRPLRMVTPGMCPHSGTDLIARTHKSRRPLFQEVLIGHPGRLHTIKLKLDSRSRSRHPSTSFDLVIATR